MGFMRIFSVLKFQKDGAKCVLSFCQKLALTNHVTTSILHVVAGQDQEQSTADYSKYQTGSW